MEYVTNGYYLCLCILSLLQVSSAHDRHYYIAAVEVEWNYAPSGRNLVQESQMHFREMLEPRQDRIGRVYTKVIYREFTDNSFTHMIPPPPWAGILGPTIRAEVGDVVYIHFRNMARKSSFSVHPHGFQYTKSNEGALYIDGTAGLGKADDAVPPGGALTYVWFVSNLHAPTADDDNCVGWGYHSHTKAPRDIDTGLVGMALTCRKGTLNPNGSRRDVDGELMLYADIAQENENWYIEYNLNRCGDPQICRRLYESKNRTFQESNDIYHINGYTFGNLPDFPAIEGRNVVWYFMSLNLGLHTMHINGQTMVVQKKRVNTVTLSPATFLSGYMTPMNPGRWLIYCRNQDHYQHGMQAFLNVVGSNIRPQLQPFPVTREYFIAIEEILWNYAPNRMSSVGSENRFLRRERDRIGSVYRKAVFRAYTDETFRVPAMREHHFGLAGPPIKASVGERVIVVVLNKARRPYSFLANGVVIDKSNEGAFYKQNRYDLYASGAIVEPGSFRAYEFTVPEYSSPTPFDTDCITNIYHSAVDLQKDIYTGLFGPLVICKAGVLGPDNKMAGIEREFYLNWMVMDENESWYLDDNIQQFIGQSLTVDRRNNSFRESNRIRAINGRTFGTLPGLDMCLGERVAWYMYGLGERFDHHHFTFDSNNFWHDGRQLDTGSVFPGVGVTILMMADQTGRHSLYNGQLGYEYEGMYVWYDVMICTDKHQPSMILLAAIPPHPVGITRQYYIAAVELDWDYCPDKTDPVDGDSLYDPDSTSFLYVRNDSGFIGSVYHKAVYREFTDNSFRQMKQRSEAEQHLGLLGPFIKGNVGDTIEIIFKNLARYPYNIVPKNVAFADGSPISGAVATLPGEIQVYKYVIPKRSGPVAKQPNCVGMTYSSRVNPMNDTYSGLMGPLIVCKKGVLDPYGRRTDGVAREFATAFVIVDENLSNYNLINFRTHAPERSNITNTDFTESNRHYSINGFIYGNIQGLDIFVGDRSAWYVFGIGSTSGAHPVHFHGQLYQHVTSLTLSRDVLEVYSGTYETIEMLAYNPGTWLVHCHLSLHTNRGMKAVYRVLQHHPMGHVARKMHNIHMGALLKPHIHTPKFNHAFLH